MRLDETTRFDTGIGGMNHLAIDIDEASWESFPANDPLE
jgi:hypothetical protein